VGLSFELEREGEFCQLRLGGNYDAVFAKRETYIEEVAAELETEMEVGPKISRTGKQEPEVKAGMQFLPDSAEQIANSIDVAGVRDEIDQVFQTAITRARRRSQKSPEPAINETGEADSGEDASQK